MNIISLKPQVLRSTLTRDVRERSCGMLCWWGPKQLSRAPHLFSLSITWSIVTCALKVVYFLIHTHTHDQPVPSSVNAQKKVVSNFLGFSIALLVMHFPLRCCHVLATWCSGISSSCYSYDNNIVQDIYPGNQSDSLKICGHNYYPILIDLCTGHTHPSGGCSEAKLLVGIPPNYAE